MSIGKLGIMKKTSRQPGAVKLLSDPKGLGIIERVSLPENGLSVLLYKEHGMRNAVVFITVLVAMAGGCVPSIHGIATKENRVWDEQLLGLWGEAKDPNKTEIWRFDRGAEEKTYGLIYVDDRGKVGRFDAALVVLSELRFLELYPKDLDEEMNGFYKMHWVPAYTFVKVEEISDELRIRMMAPDKLKKLLDKEPELIRHEVVDGAVLLTAGTAELQRFVAKYSSEVWADEVVMVRK